MADRDEPKYNRVVTGSAQQQVQVQSSPLRDTLAFTFYRFELIALAIWVVVRLVIHVAGVRIPIELPYIDSVTISLATLATVFGLSRWWPAQNILAIAFLTLALSTSIEHFLVVHTDAPYPDIAGKTIFSIPWTLPLFWFVVMLNARSVARLVLWPKREKGSYGLWLILFTAVMTALVLLVQELISNRYYNWGAPVTLSGIRLVAGILFLAIIAPFLIPKGAVVPPPDCGSVAIWAVINAYLIVIAGSEQSWESAGILVVLNGVLTTVSLRWRKKRKPKAPKQEM